MTILDQRQAAERLGVRRPSEALRLLQEGGAPVRVLSPYRWRILEADLIAWIRDRAPAGKEAP